ncbi:hypothetical protein DXG01_012131 [Tephrocybe rancida]|nr:hypothetical protein DXG01_012131 [Tephrocybe rancida]
MGVNLLVLASYPSDDVIFLIACHASQEVDSLLALLGLVPNRLHCILKKSNPHHVQQKMKSTMLTLPSVGNWYPYEGEPVSSDNTDEESDQGDTGDKSIFEAQELEELVQREADKTLFCKRHQEDQLLNLSCASAAVFADNVMKVQCLADIDEEQLEDFIAQKYQGVAELKNIAIPAIKAPDEHSKVMGQGDVAFEDLISRCSLTYAANTKPDKLLRG